MFQAAEALASYLSAPARMLEDVRAFEEEIRASEGGRWAVGVNSATSGLVASLLALGVHSGDEVIVPALSWGQTWTGALILGCRVVPVDLAKDWPVMDPKGVAAAISPRTRAVVSVGLWGSPAGLAEVDAVCRRRGVPHVVDAAQLPGTRIGRRQIGAAGDLVVLSLGLAKSFSCGEGGVVLVREDSVLRDRLLWLTQHPYRVHSEAEDEELIETARDGTGLNLRIHPLAARAGLRILKSRRGALGGRGTPARGSQKNVILGLTWTPEDGERPWIPDEDLGNDGKISRSFRTRRRMVEESAARHGFRLLRLPVRFKPVRAQSDKVLFDARGVAPPDRDAFREEVSGVANSLPCTYRPLSALSLWRRRSFLPWASGPLLHPVQQQKQTPQASRWATDIEIVSLPFVPQDDSLATKEMRREKGGGIDGEREV